jgi:beta-glucanase (GH16 family)
MSIDPTNLGATAHLTFDDEFNSLNLWNGQSGTWATTYLFADPNGNGSSLPSNGEQEWYVNSMYAPTSGVHPWTVANGVLSLTAQPTDPSISGLLGYANGQGPGLGSYAYTSGLITSAHSFAQTYGYFEMSAKLPAGQGLWPAFWLLPASGQWPPELDIMEVLGKDTGTLYTSAHTAQTGEHVSSGLASAVGDMSAGFHTYGLDWEADKVTWYFDGHQVYQIDTPADMHQPMYMLANLAVGGPWGGNADASTPLQSQMQIDYIRAYASGPGDATAAAPLATAGSGGSAVAPPTDGGPETAQTFVGSDAADTWFGGQSNDQAWLGGGDDVANGLKGDDTLNGGEGADRLYGGQGDDVVAGDAGNDFLHGNMGDDTVSGSTGDDTLLGGQGNDLLVGGDGNDWISGDRGDDTLSGGAGTDTFHFAQGSGHDVITDFNTWEGDHLQLEPGMTWTASQEGSDVVVDFGGGDQVTLQNVQLASLHDGWIG